MSPHSAAGRVRARDRGGRTRSEEHTSELQSPWNLVCRLLLEKKNRLGRGGRDCPVMRVVHEGWALLRWHLGVALMVGARVSLLATDSVLVLVGSRSGRHCGW